MLERDIQKMSLQFIERHPRLKVLRIPDEVYLVLRLAAEGKHISKGLAIKARTAIAAWPDELVFKGLGDFAGCLIRENKREKGGVVTPAQRDFFADLSDRRIPGFICRGLEPNLELTRKFANWLPLC